MGVLRIAVLLFQVAVTLSVDQCSLDEAVTGSEQCTVQEDCSGLECSLPSPFLGYTGTYTTKKCVDPVQVTLTLHLNGQQTFMGRFNQSEIVQFGGDTSVNVTMGRNSTHLDFQATIYHSLGPQITLFPEAFVPLDPAGCMCSSLEEVGARAESVHSAVESNCATTSVVLDSGLVECGAVQCTLSIPFIFTYNAKLVPLPCNGSVTFIVTDVFNLPVVTERFQGPTDETRSVRIGIFDVDIRQVIILYDYSMEVQTFLSNGAIGTLEIVPLYRIILDKTQCDIPSFPPIVTTTIVPPPSPPSPGSSYNCFRWYDIAEGVYNSSLIFNCALKDVCDTGLNCILAIARVKYRVGINFVNDMVSISVTSENGSSSYPAVLEGVADRQVQLPMPLGSLLLLRQRINESIGFVGFELDLNVTVLNSNVESSRTDNLIPYSSFLTQSDPCPPLESVLMDYPQCRASSCSGLTCQPMAPFDDYTASYSVTKCADPVYVDLSLTPASLDGQAFIARVTSNNVVNFGGNSGMGITMSRNATHLDFQATIFSPGLPPSTLFPESFLPLDPADCMCSSLETLASVAESIHPVIESDCVTTRNCTAVRCELNIATIFTYFIEMVVLPCNNSLEFLIEDTLGQAIVVEPFQGPGTESRIVTVLGFQFNIEMAIQVQNYSMTVQTFLTDQTLGTLEVIPRQTIILDRTQCDIPEFPTVAMPTRPPRPAPVTSDASSACVALNNIVQDVYDNSPIFRCMLMEECESGLTCVLDIANTEYRVNISFSQNRSVAFSVSSVDGECSYGMSKDKNQTVELPSPHDSYLMFSVSRRSQQTVGFMLQLQVSFLTSQQQTDVLIPYTEVTWPTPSSNIALIVILVVVFVLLTAILIVGLAITILCLLRRGKLQREPFDFQRMSDLQEKELENYLKTDPANPLPGVGTPPSSGGGASSKEEGEELAKIDLTAYSN